MDNLKQLKNQIRGLFPKANEKGIAAIAKILDQCCCEFDPCNVGAIQLTDYRIDTYVGIGTVIEEGISGTTGISNGSTTISNIAFNTSNPTIYKGNIVLSKVNNGIDTYYSIVGNNIILSSPLVTGEHLLITN